MLPASDRTPTAAGWTPVETGGTVRTVATVRRMGGEPLVVELEVEVEGLEDEERPPQLAGGGDGALEARVPRGPAGREHPVEDPGPLGAEGLVPEDADPDGRTV